mgnify:CR=1 FL=1
MQKSRPGVLNVFKPPPLGPSLHGDGAFTSEGARARTSSCEETSRPAVTATLGGHGESAGGRLARRRFLFITSGVSVHKGLQPLVMTGKFCAGESPGCFERVQNRHRSAPRFTGTGAGRRASSQRGEPYPQSPSPRARERGVCSSRAQQRARGEGAFTSGARGTGRGERGDRPAVAGSWAGRRSRHAATEEADKSNAEKWHKLAQKLAQNEAQGRGMTRKFCARESRRCFVPLVQNQVARDCGAGALPSSRREETSKRPSQLPFGASLHTRTQAAETAALPPSGRLPPPAARTAPLPASAPTPLEL